jgi:hypothetical protein
VPGTATSRHRPILCDNPPCPGFSDVIGRHTGRCQDDGLSRAAD